MLCFFCAYLTKYQAKSFLFSESNSYIEPTTNFESEYNIYKQPVKNRNISDDYYEDFSEASFDYGQEQMDLVRHICLFVVFQLTNFQCKTGSRLVFK